jgi:hypothetical protein
MFIRFIILVARAINGLIQDAIAFGERSADSRHALIAHYVGRRWCDSTERELNDALTGRGSWLGNRFDSQK